MAPTKPTQRKDFGGVHKAKDRMYPAQRRAAAKKAGSYLLKLAKITPEMQPDAPLHTHSSLERAIAAAMTCRQYPTFSPHLKPWVLLSVRAWLTNVAERQAAAADRHLQNQVRAQGDRWLRFQAYSSGDLLYQPIRLWLEYQSVRKHKSLPRLVRDKLDFAFQRPQEMDVAGAHFETERANRREELGKEEGVFFDDWCSGEPSLSPFFHGWRWWSALSKLDEKYRATFFSKFVVSFDVDGLPILLIPPLATMEDFLSPAVPEYGDPHVQDQVRIWNEERKALREEKETEQCHAYEAMQNALEEEERLAHLLDQMTVGAEGEAEESGVVHDVEDRMESTVF